MNQDAAEIERRASTALAVIKKAVRDDDSDVGIFVSHHLEEIGAEYWREHTGTTEPDATQVIDLLELRSHWSDNDDDHISDTYDFTLPGDATDYVISVHFGDDGEVDRLEMES